MDLTHTAPDNGEVLRKRSLTDEVYDYLYGKIIAGKYPAGDWLRQEDISSQLGVSQTPVREALDRLVSTGLAERVPYRGVRVPKLDEKEIVDAFMLRMVLENLAARLAAAKISRDEVQALTTIVSKTEELVSLESMPALRRLNKEFHSQLVNYAGSPLLSKVYEMVINSFPDWMLYEYMFRHPELLQTSLRREFMEHQAIVEALAQNDALRAANQVSGHINNLGKELEIYLDISGEAIREIERQIESMISTVQK